MNPPGVPKGDSVAIEKPVRPSAADDRAAALQHRRARVALRGVGLRVSERRLLLLIMDVTLLVGALALSIRIGTEWLDPPDAFFALWRWWLTLIVVWWLIANLLECYDLARAASAPHSIITVSAAAALTVIAYTWIPLFTPPLASRSLVLLFALLAFGGLAAWRGLYAVLFVQPNFQRRALVLGAGLAGRALVQAVQQTESTAPLNPLRGTGYQIAGFVDDDAAKQTAEPVAGVPVLGGSEDLLRLAQELQVDEVVLAITQRQSISEAAFDAILACREAGFHVTTMPALYERLLGRVPVEHVGRNVQAALPIEEGGAGERIFWLSKRLADVSFGLLGLTVTAFVAPFVALGNAIFCRGPLFYRQTRLGRGGLPFTVIKFRTMRPNAEQDTGAVWSEPSDDRITPVGRWLRKSRLDELPQVINVIRGEMSLIGPRPERPEFVDRLSREIPFYRARHAVKPGLTGWAQVRFGYGNSLEDARIKLEYDLYYVRHADFYLDTLILLKTVGVVVRFQGE
jgi:exopolysaccharide biosynthesis polyprenyl glycosylphosphotransferase